MVPEPRKQAAKGQKQILKENQETVLFYTCVVAVASGIYLATTWLMFWKEFSFKYQMLFGLTSVIYLSALALMKRFSRARFASDGGVVDAGVDLNMPNGMAEHLKDVILLVAMVQGAALLWNYFWFLLLLIPGRAFHLLWRSVLAPYFFQPAPPEMDEKKQKKMERKGNRRQ